MTKPKKSAGVSAGVLRSFFKVEFASQPRWVNLTRAQRDRLRTLLDKEPSVAFVNGLQVTIASYQDHVAVAEQAKPGKAIKRLKRFSDAAAELLLAATNMEGPEWRLVSMSAGQKPLDAADFPAIALEKNLIEFLTEIAAAAQGAVDLTNDVPTAGRSENFAGRALASRLLSLLWRERGVRPPHSRKAEFERLLLWAMGVATGYQGDDAYDLMEHAFSNAPVELDFAVFGDDIARNLDKWLEQIPNK